MDANALLLIALTLIGVGLLFFWRAGRKQAAIQMPSGTPVYLDTPEQPGTVLVSKTCRLNGKPDFLLREQGVIIPVEVKTGRTPRTPYFGHIMQLMAYCVLVEETYGVRPPYGVIRYSGQQYRIEFTPERERALVQILADMRQKRHASDVPRNHSNAKLCAACGFRVACDQRLDEQLPLPLNP